MNVVLHAIGCIPPFIQMIFTYRIFRQLADLYPQKEEEKAAAGTQPSSVSKLRGLDQIFAINPALTGITFTLMMWYFATQLQLGPEPLQPFIGSIFATIPLVVGQDMLNAFWYRLEPPDKEVRTQFNNGEWVLLFLAIVFLGFNIFGMFIPMPKLPTPANLSGR
jgi:hypothetical protein